MLICIAWEQMSHGLNLLIGREGVCVWLPMSEAVRIELHMTPCHVFVPRGAYLQKRTMLPITSTRRAEGIWKALRVSVVNVVLERCSSRKAEEFVSWLAGKASSLAMYLSK